ncbi:methionyl-tRNA formyltransferase [Patescibacteria group bacterium AH-259-L07]|nr:methionyl-tRNA formyltransferase [Patescibacteria group bacterium AH-259-L07]
MIKGQNNIVFFGTPEFAAVILKMLVEAELQPAAIVTSSDKPVGRKQILTPSPVKELALQYNLKIFQPETLKNNLEIINNLSLLKPDLFVLAAYGLILPQEILDIPKYGCLNIHPSLLPKYRGASPIQAALLNGDNAIGVTIIVMDEKVDHGPIIANAEFRMQNTEFTYSELSKQLAELGGKLLIKVLPGYLNGKIKSIPQDHTKATFTKRIKKQDGKIDWSKSAQYIEAMTRAYYSWPTVYSNLTIEPRKKSKISNGASNKRLKVIRADILDVKHNKHPGTIFLTKSKQLAVACGKNALLLKKIQLEGKKPISGKDFLNGYPNIVGAVFL